MNGVDWLTMFDSLNADAEPGARAAFAWERWYRDHPQPETWRCKRCDQPCARYNDYCGRACELALPQLK